MLREEPVPITANISCPLVTGESRKESESYLSSLGTESGYWKLANVSAQFPVGWHPFIIPVGAAVTNKQSGIPLKRALLDRRIRDKDFSLFEEPWGLQLSLCTGVARRVPLRALIEESLLRYVDNLSIDGWEKLKTKATPAIRGDRRFTEWTQTLEQDERQCMQTIFEKLLELLKDTGFDQSGKHFSILWPYDSDARFCIKIRPEKDQLWWSILKDSE